MVYTNTKNILEATYFDNRVANMKSRFMRVLTRDHSLAFFAVDGQDERFSRSLLRDSSNA